MRTPASQSVGSPCCPFSSSGFSSRSARHSASPVCLLAALLNQACCGPHSNALRQVGTDKSKANRTVLFRQPHLPQAALSLNVCPSPGGIPMSSALYFVTYLAFALPFLAIASILLYSAMRNRFLKLRKNRRTANPALCSSSAALTTILLIAQIFYRPSLTHFAEVRQQVDADDDDAGDPDTATRQLNRQLQQIRRGEPVDHIELRL
jgi:hypothetical protein